jgi:hypothetical protein
VERFLQVVVDGIADGSIYAALALALVLIFRSTGVVNFAQGEMAMFSTFVAWALADAGVPLGLAVVGALAFAFAAGMVVERVLIRPVEGRQPAQPGDRHARPVHRRQLRRRLDLGLQHQGVPGAVPRRGRADRQRLAVDRVARHHRRAARRGRPAVAAVHQDPDRAGDAGRRPVAVLGPAGRHPGRPDAHARLGTGLAARRARRGAGRAPACSSTPT